MFQRAIQETLEKSVKMFPVTFLTGPRQSGKTTLLKQLFPDFRYITLESPDQLAKIQSDPRDYLSSTTMWCIDEAQNFPELFSYIQEFVDHQGYKFILSGSQNFLLFDKITQSLAGRTAILQLLPLSYPEYRTDAPDNFDHFLFHGSYPRVYHEKLDVHMWYQSYIATYLERDIRTLSMVGDLVKFHNFIKLCAGRHGQLLNITALAVDAGVSQPTANHWLSILEASYIVFRLQPYFNNLGKRVVKTPKLYFYDTSLVCQLYGIENVEHMRMHSAYGSLFEGFVITEMIKEFLNKGRTPAVYFWRDHTGHEIDMMVERWGKLEAFEIKSSATFSKKWLQGLSFFKSFDCRLNIVYKGKEQFQVQNINVLPAT